MKVWWRTSLWVIRLLVSEPSINLATTRSRQVQLFTFWCDNVVSAHITYEVFLQIALNLSLTKLSAPSTRKQRNTGDWAVVWALIHSALMGNFKILRSRLCPRPIKWALVEGISIFSSFLRCYSTNQGWKPGE